MARLYTVVYVAKKDPEARLNTVHNDDTDVSVLLKVRTVGLPMMWYFVNGGQLFDLNRDVVFFPCLFESNGYFVHSFGKLFAAAKKNLKMRSLTITEKYLWRPQPTRHLRVEQLVRFFKISTKHANAKEKESKEKPCRGFTKEWREVHDLLDDKLHPNYDGQCAAMPPGKIITYDSQESKQVCLVKRSTRAYGCLRTYTHPPTSDNNKDHGTTNRDLFFHQRLFMSLPWYCSPHGRIQCKPAICQMDSDGTISGQPRQIPIYLDQLHKDTQDGNNGTSHEAICKRIEHLFAKSACHCCNGTRSVPCNYCGHVFQRVGWHRCDHVKHLVWRTGTLWSADNETISEQYLLDMKARGDGFKHIEKQAKEFVENGILTEKTAAKILTAMSADMGEKEMYRAWNEEDEDEISSSSRVSPECARVELEKEVLAYETRLKSVWCSRTKCYKEGDKPTSQYKAYNQLVLRQKHGKPMYIIIHAEAGYGKSDLIMAFMAHEKKHEREWVKLAPSGVAALNVKGFTLHFFLKMDDQYQVKIEKDSEEANRL